MRKFEKEGAAMDIGQEQQSGVRNNETRVLVVESDTALRKQLIELIRIQGNLEVCFEAKNAIEAVETTDRDQIDLAIVGSSPEDTSRIQLADKLKSQHPYLPILILPSSDIELYSKDQSHSGNRYHHIGREACAQIMEALHQAKTLVNSRISGFILLVKLQGSNEDECRTTQMC
jgi:DNA-binding NarL/FixJ family response regulator